MALKKTTVAVVCGGRTSEHEVSLCSARNIAQALDKNTFTVVLIKIEKNGLWKKLHSVEELATYVPSFDSAGEEQAVLNTASSSVEILRSMHEQKLLEGVDVVFPIIHGTYGEDGCLQGLLRMLNIPFVGPDVLSSAIGMDKDVTKRLLLQAQLPVCKHLVYRSHPRSDIQWSKVTAELGTTVFVKPANAGSSVGVRKAVSEQEFYQAVEHAFEYDTKILCEEAIVGRELECAVMGNAHPRASAVGELVLKSNFYSYEAKYLLQDAATPQIPADLPQTISEQVRHLALQAYRTLECRGLCRVDFFYSKQGQIYLNEVNTLPGFTNISMYPKMWEASGVPYPQLVEQLITYAMEHAQTQHSYQRHSIYN